MRGPAPDILRKGALVRVMGGTREAGTEVLALAFLDLRFSDGHVERWLGPGRIGTLPAEPDGMAALQRWAADTANEFAFDIACDIARDFETLGPPAVDHLPCDEVVVEWNHPPLD